ncbi:hypothetical protein KJ903_04595 [Patescibacteria group bacterium]|nr:hypothetical protein [Patescibacteria group bacterium]
MEQPENPAGSAPELTQAPTPTPEQQPEPESSKSNEPKKKSKLVLIIFALLLLLIIGVGLVYYFVFYNKDSADTDSQDTTSEQTEQTKETVKVDLSQYDGKVLQITSSKDNIEGKVWLTYDSEDDSLKAQFNALLTADLPVNGTCGGSVEGATGCQDMIRHEYAQKTISQKNSSNSFGVFLYPVLCNKTKQLEKSEWDTKFEIYGASACGMDTHIQEKTSTFLIWGQIYYDSYEKILGLYDVTVYDSSQYWIETTDKNSQKYKDDPEGSRYFELESQDSIVDKNKVSDYVMEFKE